MTKTAAGKKSKKKHATADDVLAALSTKHKDGLHLGKNIQRGGVISTGSLNLDAALNGGLIQGKIIECYGAESSGKTALAYTAMAQHQHLGACGFIDGESAYDTDTAHMYGVRSSNVIVQKPYYIEEGMEMLLDMIEAGCKYVVFDSIAGIPPKIELEGNMEDHNVGKKASRMGQLMRKLHHLAEDHKCTVFFINQIRDSMAMFGPSVTTPGGHALQFHASYRLWIISTPKIEAPKGTLRGQNMNIMVKKTKFGPPGRKVLVPLIYGDGISQTWELMQLAFDTKVLDKRGSWVRYGDVNIAQGEWNAYTFLEDNPELMDEIKSKINECTSQD